MIIVTGKVKAPLDKIEELRPLMETVVAATRREKGCIGYSYGVDILDPATIIAVEYWEDWPSLEAHFAQPHMQPWIKALSEVEFTTKSIKAAEAVNMRQLMGD